MRRLFRLRFLVPILLVVLLAIGIIMKGLIVWPINSTVNDLAALLGVDNSTSWLKRGEVVAWTPDLNERPQRYFVVAPLSHEEFLTWARTIKLNISESPNIPDGVWVLPVGINPNRWIAGNMADRPLMDASGTTQRSTVWARWSEGVVFMVVYPTW